MNRRMIVLGAGGHARVVVALARALGFDVVGCTDGDPARKGGDVLGVPVLGDDTTILDYPADTILLAVGIGSNGPPRVRRAVYEEFSARGYAFPTLIHPTALVDASARIGTGTQVMAGSIVQPLGRIGCNGIVNTRAVVEHDCVVGDHVHLATGCILAGGVQVGDLCHVGAGAVLRNAVRLASGVTVGAGAAVVADVAAGQTVAGVPARPLASGGMSP